MTNYLAGLIGPQAPQAHDSIAATVMFALIVLVGALLTYRSFGRA
jgi:hypothetical protein